MRLCASIVAVGVQWSGWVIGIIFFTDCYNNVLNHSGSVLSPLATSSVLQIDFHKLMRIETQIHRNGCRSDLDWSRGLMWLGFSWEENTVDANPYAWRKILCQELCGIIFILIVMLLRCYEWCYGSDVKCVL